MAQLIHIKLTEFEEHRLSNLITGNGVVVFGEGEEPVIHIFTDIDERHQIS